jgi:hypothetical protein
MRSEGIPGDVSNTAGTGVCYQIIYRCSTSLIGSSREACGIRARAIHATTGGRKLGQPALGVEVMITALTAGWGATADDRCPHRSAAYTPMHDGRIISTRLYFDQLDMLTQLGLMPAS